MLAIFLSWSVIAMILLIWFRTDAFLEYCKVFHLDKISFYKHYESIKKHEDMRMTYHQYLLTYHNNFFTRLITCPVCMAFWVAGFYALLSLKACALPVAMIGGLILYLIIDKLLE